MLTHRCPRLRQRSPGPLGILHTQPTSAAALELDPQYGACADLETWESAQQPAMHTRTSLRSSMTDAASYACPAAGREQRQPMHT